MKEVKSGNQREERKEFPETKRLEDGDSIVAIATEQHQAETKYGEALVCEVVIRGEPLDKSFSLFWPYKLPVPPLNTPFYLARRSKRDWHLILAEGADESARLWKDGDLNGPKPAAGEPVVSGIQKIIDSFTT